MQGTPNAGYSLMSRLTSSPTASSWGTGPTTVTR